ncbi:helix-turn-helix domain-containing protein [Streptomyces sp. MS19]|uniref:helix-turn-helix domain-containing protein n=1 Tax=Streptomyces sp. MS19 TaxID=3385972 RepID=UPI0039A3C175
MIRLARRDAGVSQQQLGQACGLSQSAISRLENARLGAYDMTTLAKAARHLNIPARLVGLADHAGSARLEGPVERRNFLAVGAAAVTASPLLPSIAPHAAEASSRGATLRVATAAYRRLDGTAPARDLLEPVLSHLRLTKALVGESPDEHHRAHLAAAGSEAASFAGWLCWDLGDLGSARTWYGTSIKAARRVSDPLLGAYQVGSLAQMEAHVGNTSQSLSLIGNARKRLGSSAPAIADAWLRTIEALAHASAGDEQRTDRALRLASEATHRISNEEAPWPWVFPFNQGKVAAARLSCGARLMRPDWVQAGYEAAGPVLDTGHEKQRAQLHIDLAFGHLAAGRLDVAFALATRALEVGLRYRSGRTVERARALRRSYTSPTPPRVVRDFDDRLHDIYL